MSRRVRREDPGLTLYGPIVDMVLSVPKRLQDVLEAQGMPLPQPVGVRALIDTGASCCGIMEGMPSRLGLEPIGTKVVRRGGYLRFDHRFQYLLHLAILSESAEVVFSQEVFFVEDHLGGDEYRALIGRDVLDEAVFVYHGPRKKFRLQF